MTRRIRTILPEEEWAQRHKETLEKKRLTRKIRGLKDKVQKIIIQKKKIQTNEKEMKADLARQKCTNKKLSACLIEAKRKAKDLKEQLNFETKNSEYIAFKSSSLERKVSMMQKPGGGSNLGVSWKNLQGHFDIALKQVDLWMQENQKLLNEKIKLERQVESLQAHNDMLHAEAASKKAEIDVHKHEIKHETFFLGMKREAQQVNSKIQLEME